MDDLKKYTLDELLITQIWQVLFESSNEKLASSVAKQMIEQGCESIPVDDVGLVLMFWKDYLEEKGIISFTLENKIVH